jgi:hypothetical protein
MQHYLSLARALHSYSGTTVTTGQPEVLGTHSGLEQRRDLFAGVGWKEAYDCGPKLNEENNF